MCVHGKVGGGVFFLCVCVCVCADIRKKYAQVTYTSAHFYPKCVFLDVYLSCCPFSLQTPAL